MSYSSLSFGGRLSSGMPLPRCQQSVFVDREEHQEERLLVCPLPGCNYVWCKACQQEITIGGPQHSCDGSSELNHLMEQQGWRHCPGTRFKSSLLAYRSPERSCRMSDAHSKGFWLQSYDGVLIPQTRPCATLDTFPSLRSACPRGVTCLYPFLMIRQSVAATDPFPFRHFCYTCGESIIRSSLRQEIKDAVSVHYRRNCLLF